MASQIYIAELRLQEKLLTDYLGSGERLSVLQIAKLSREILRLRSEINFYEKLRAGHLDINSKNIKKEKFFVKNIILSTI
ncbi:hypothetical protein [Flagellimonas nanhaiensis]|uniref:Uncharacterized protein n=1 Tax=Flagellimonas nanhaiensis TaxID=2292706 RepID=A0A371JNU5_9FLAO|nr:hypothetical protein [Allomuricauda nanhaiensis]RDY58907.1 hypothetical protein DX873_14710 [Allomuricauda nanhaiensis]